MGTDFADKGARLECGSGSRCATEGLIAIAIHPGNVLLLAPPLVISEDEIDQLVGMFDRAFTRLAAERPP